MTTITIIHEIRLSAETMQFVRELAKEIAGALKPGTPAGVNATITPHARDDDTRGGADLAGEGGQTSRRSPGDAPPTHPPQGDARPAGDEPALLDVSSQTQAPADVTNPAGASFSATPKPVLWSTERDAVLREGYPAGQTNKVLLDRVNALPGRIVKLNQILSRCMYLKQRRAPGVHEKPPVPAARAAAPVAQDALQDEPEFLERTEADILQWCAFAKYNVVAPLTSEKVESINAFRRGKGLPPYQRIAKPPPPPPKQPHVASYGTILRWANDRGLCMDGVLDLDVVNAKARAIGATPFELEEPPRRAAPSIIRHHQQQQENT